MSNNYIWAFDDSALGNGFNGAFSVEYHLSNKMIAFTPEQLIESNIWVLLRTGGELLLYALLRPSYIEMYQEGLYEGDYLLQCDSLSSIRFLPRKESTNSWKLQFEVGQEVRECTNEEQSTLFELVRKNTRVGFAPPSLITLNSVPRTTFLNFESAVLDQHILTLRSVSYGDASRSHFAPESISALGEITLTILKSTHPQFSEKDIISLVSSIDPVATIESKLSVSRQTDLFHSLASLPPLVDTFFEVLDIEKIAPRIFIAKSEFSRHDWLDKTNNAEREHEQILKDLAVFMLGEGFRVYKTRSFDLYAEKGELKILWEIKSANEYNSVSQGEKGIMQLLRYSIALANINTSEIRYAVLLQDSCDELVKHYLSKMADRAGSELWLYKSKEDWPNRVISMYAKNLKNLI